LKEAGKPCLPSEIAFGIGKKREGEHGVVRKAIYRLYERGDVARNSSNNTYEISFTRRSDDKNLDQRGSPDEGKEGNDGASQHFFIGGNSATQHVFDGEKVQTSAAESKNGATETVDKWSNFREFGKINIFDFSHSPFLESIYSFFTSNCKPFLPHLALGATINCAGHLMRPMGQCRGKRTNFYTLLICRTGGGKDSIAHYMSEFMDYQKLGAYRASNFVSVQGFEKQLKELGGLMFMITDEAAQWFGAFSGRNTSEHFKKLKTALKLVYSGKRYLCQNSKKEDGYPIEYPFVNASFLGTPAIFQNIREDDITDGLLGRMLVFHDTNNNWGISAYDLARAEDFIRPKLLEITAPPKPFELYEKNNWFDLLHFYEQLLNSMPSPDSLPDNYTQYLLARVPENFNKLLMLTMNDQGEVSLAGARWAASVAVYCYETACSLLDANFGKTFFSDAHHKMLGIIRSAGTLYKGQLRASHAMRRLDKRVFEEALDALEEMGMVELVTKQPDISGGRPAVSIRLTEKGEKPDETI